MAEKPLTTTRRALLGAAASLPVLALPGSEEDQSTNLVRPERSRGARPEPSRNALLWNRRLTRYRCLATRMKEAAETGFFRTANDRYNRERAEVDRLLATLSAHPEEGLCLSKARLEGRRKAAFARVAAAEEAFYTRCTRPMQQAAALLALTPVPDLPALLTNPRNSGTAAGRTRNPRSARAGGAGGGCGAC